MPDSTAPLSPPPDDLQFNVAEPSQASSSQGSGPACAICKAPITTDYFVVRQSLICPRCREYIGRPAAGSPLGRFIKAGIFGLVAGLAGTVIWYAIRVMTNSEFGIVAMLVGFMVGKAVLKGSGGWGGAGYRALAVLITYFCIAATFVPAVLEAAKQQAGKAHQAKLDAPRDAKIKDKAGAAQKGLGDAEDEADKAPLAKRTVAGLLLAVVILVALSLALPVFVGFSSPIMLVIFGIGLWEAWRFAARPVPPIKGPFQLNPQAP